MTSRLMRMTVVGALLSFAVVALVSSEEKAELASKLAKEVRITVARGNFDALLRLPAGWKQYRNRLLVTGTSFVAPQQKGYAPRVLVTFQRSGTTLKVYVADLKLKLGKLLSDWRIDKEKYIKVGSYESWQVVQFYGQGNMNFRSLQTIIAVKGWKVSITFTAQASEFARLEKLFRDSTASFRITGKTAGEKGSSKENVEK